MDVDRGGRRPRLRPDVTSRCPDLEQEQAAVSDRHDYFPAHDLPFEMGVGVIFARVVVAVLCDRLMRGEFFQPFLIIIMQAGLVVVDKHRRCDMHGVDQDKPFPDTTLANRRLNLAGYIHESASLREIECQLFAKAFHV